ncbi:MAG: peptidase T [Clostridiales bacterium]|nr:peptidase T [Clostridiales bacterium]
MKTVTERFLSYITYDTQSKDDAPTVPSTDKQFVLAKKLCQELEEMGASEVTLTDHCYVMATIPATTTKQTKVLGFISHMDTATSMSGENVKARIIKNYEGGDIVLNEELNIIMKESEFSSLRNNIGKDLIVTDGTTLLGADDKAGIAEIMTMASYLLSHPEIEHGKIRIGFTPDEEVGHGVDYFDVEAFGADYAYTVDGGTIGEIEYENFNAASAQVTISGTSIHPGSAKGKMKNAILLGMELQQMLPVFENPMYTEGYEGFYHLDKFEGDIEQAKMVYIIRDHDKEKFEQKKEMLRNVVNFMNSKYGKDTVVVDIKDSYYNMKEKVEPHMHLIEDAKKAMLSLGIEPIVVPIRGGTDGARLSYMGLPCPNLCTGGENFHGKYEYITIQGMETVVKLLVSLAKKTAN